MRIYLNPDGAWRIENGVEGVHTYEDLPEVVKRILNLALVVIPYGEMYLDGEEEEAAKRIGEVVGFNFDTGRLTVFTYETYGARPSRVYYIYIDNDTVRNYYRTQENEPN